MKKTTPLITGTIILTVAGLFSRVIGFFYRIFLSRTFGEEGMGIYQLIAPVLALSFSFSTAGIQTAISKYVASEPSTKNHRYSFGVVLSGTILSVMLSLFIGGIVYYYSVPIATDALLEPRCAPLLRIIAVSFPFASLHSCVNGYFYGIKKASVPAFTQLAEQMARVGSVYVIFFYAVQQGYSLTINFAVIGSVIGEIVSMIISMIAIYFRFYHFRRELRIPSRKEYFHLTGNLVKLGAPLCANRVIINFLQSIEAIYIPNNLIRSGLTSSEALSVYGVLMGMVLPLILFPSALTNSVSVLLLPVIAEAQSTGNYRKISATIKKDIFYCSLLGITCTIGFLLFGNWLGTYIFRSPMAGSFIMTLCFICPFIYLGSTLGSVLNGLGKTMYTFVIHFICLSLRLLFVFFLVPVYGITAYMWGLVASELLDALLTYLVLRKYIMK